MACEGKTRAYVYFKSKEEDWQRIVSLFPPVSYDFTEENATCWSFQGTGGQILRFEVLACGTVPEWRFFKSGPDINGDQRTYYKPYVDNIDVSPSGGFTTFSNSIVESDGSRAAVYRSYGSCSHCLSDECLFSVIDQSGEIFSRLFYTGCPDVKVVCGDECPPNTCECRHSNRVCCYNDKGIIIKSFLV